MWPQCPLEGGLKGGAGGVVSGDFFQFYYFGEKHWTIWPQNLTNPPPKSTKIGLKWPSTCQVMKPSGRKRDQHCTLNVNTFLDSRHLE